MNNIIWLASYPKSGNTWFRYFLINLLADRDEPLSINRMEAIPIAGSRMIFDQALGIASSDLSHEEIDRLRPEVYRLISDHALEPRYFKVHDAYTRLEGGAPLIPPEATRKAVYFIRNPLDIAVSYANHAGIGLDLSIQRMGNPEFGFYDSTRRLDHQLRQRLSSWSGHVLSWVEAKDIDLLVVRYEDMKLDAFSTFQAATAFLELQKSDEQINRALNFSSFSKLQRQEQLEGFHEKPSSCGAFFNKGEIGAWRQALTQRQIDKIIMDHHDMMERFGYI